MYRKCGRNRWQVSGLTSLETEGQWDLTLFWAGATTWPQSAVPAGRFVAGRYAANPYTAPNTAGSAFD